MAKELSFTEQLCYITTRIVTIDNNKDVHIATGFFVAYPLSDDTSKFIVVLVTNRHVVEKAETMNIWLNEKDSEGNPMDDKMVEISILNAKDKFIYHPDGNIDLAIYPIVKTINEMEKSLNIQSFYKTLPLGMMMTDSQATELDAVEDVLMVGYPRGLWDEKNNRPIFRTGVTATDPKVDYEGKKEFLIDCACIQGSSGSPVLMFYKGVYCNKFAKETCFDSLKAVLIGIQYAIPIQQTEGKIVKTETPTKEKEDTPVIGLPINLGYIIKVQCLFDFIPLLEKNEGMALARP